MIFIMNSLSRHRFLRTGVAADGGLLLSLRLPLGHRDAKATDSGDFVPDAFMRVGTDGQILLTMPGVEMGPGTGISQGPYTAISMLIAEELEVDPARIRLEHAPAKRVDGCSTALRASWMPMRQVSAIAREMLAAAAAQRWKVDPGACQTRSGEVVHTASGRRFGYGELAAHAGRLLAPEIVALKPLCEPLIDCQAARRQA